MTAYRWLRDTLDRRRPGGGLYHDKVLGDGGIDTTQWIYNQGVSIAAGVMLHRADGEGNLPGASPATADAALAWYGAREYQGQPAIFVAIFFRNLLSLAPDPATPATELRCRRTPIAPGTTRPSTIPPPTCSGSRASSPCTLLDQAAMVQILALLAWRSTSTACSREDEVRRQCAGHLAHLEGKHTCPGGRSFALPDP